MERYSGESHSHHQIVEGRSPDGITVQTTTNHQIKQEKPYDIPKGKRRFDLARALVLLFFHGLGASSSTTALGLLGAFSSEAWLHGLPLSRFGTWSHFRSRDGYVAAASSYGFATNSVHI
ncbi:hypothetical protein F8M41_017417 [Gigaspora margarita]|uniref:Uncharacterized protein n=1 Tax=Gigaspora margarita TaxID=4874 RepID=A0A8H4B5M5_GIGMA|nr:hypothetical protein F8M41_017417 [Gigaspora margarita]